MDTTIVYVNGVGNKWIFMYEYNDRIITISNDEQKSINIPTDVTPSTNVVKINNIKLMSIIEVLKWFNGPKGTLNGIPIESLLIVTDSLYCKHLIEEWMDVWKLTAFENRPNKENITLLNELMGNLKVKIKHLYKADSIMNVLLTKLNGST